MRGSSSMITRHAKRVRPARAKRRVRGSRRTREPDRLDADAPCDATAAAFRTIPAATAPMAVPPGVGLGARHHGGGAAALSPGPALSHRQSGFDPDALA